MAITERDMIFYLKGVVDAAPVLDEKIQQSIENLLVDMEETMFVKHLRASLITPAATKAIIEIHFKELLKESPSFIERTQESFKGLFSHLFKE